MIRELLQRWEGAPFNAVRDCVVGVCALAVLFSVTWSFINYHQRKDIAQKRRSPVDTFTMLLFFFLFSWLLGRQSATLTVAATLQTCAAAPGLVLVVLGAVVNVVGRHQLGSAWANQIAIYEKHRLRTNGMFALVRHPLYASLIWMFIGAAIAFLNWAALLATLLIFVPAMHLRAAQEERLLNAAFPDYHQYRMTTGEFLPKLKTLCKVRL